jgi:hypothetical protein
MVSDITNLTVESPEVVVIVLSESGKTSSVPHELGNEGVGKTPTCSSDLRTTQERSSNRTDVVVEVAKANGATVAGGDGETEVKKSKARRRKGQKKEAEERAQAQAAATTSSSGSSVPSGSTLPESSEQSATSSQASGASSGSSSNGSLEQSIYATRPSQRGSPSQPKESSRARRWRTFQESLATGDGYMGGDGRWYPNNPNKSRGGRRGGFRDGSFRGNHRQPFQQQATFHQQPPFPQQPTPQQPFPQQEPFHPKLPFPLQRPFPQQAAGQINMVWDESLHHWVYGSSTAGSCA